MRIKTQVELFDGDMYCIAPNSKNAYMIHGSDFTFGKYHMHGVAKAHISVKKYYDPADFLGESNIVDVQNDTVNVSVEGDMWQEYKPPAKSSSPADDEPPGC